MSIQSADHILLSLLVIVLFGALFSDLLKVVDDLVENSRKINCKTIRMED
jgi:hypothetical protein